MILSKLSDSEKRPSEKLGNTLLLIDLKKHTRGGHYGPWLKFFAIEFTQRFDRVVVVTPDPNLTRGLFQENYLRMHDSLSFFKLPWYFRVVLAVKCLAKELVSPNEKVSFFVMWGDDLIPLLKIKQELRWATLSGLSRILRQPWDKKTRLESSVLAIIDSDQNCRGFFQPDGYIKSPSSKAIWIPVIENIETLDVPSNLINKIKLFSAGKITIGALGILTGERCINALLELARYQPDVNFVLIGKIDYRNVKKNLRQDLIQGKKSNLFIHPYFLEAEEELNSAIEAIDGIFIDGKNYAPHSGIVCKGLYFGKGIVSPMGNSWTNDIIDDGQVGISYSDPQFDLQARWIEWKNNGGSNNSIQKSEEMRSPLVVKQSFDRLSKNLVS